MRSRASRAMYGSSATTSATGSPTNRTTSRAMAGCRYRSVPLGAGTRLGMTAIAGTSAAVSTARTPGRSCARFVSVDTRRAWACGERSTAACSIPATRTSSTNSPITATILASLVAFASARFARRSRVGAHGTVGPGVIGYAPTRQREVAGQEEVTMSGGSEVKERTEVRDGMRITWQQPITMDDGLVVRADVFRPVEDGRSPVILSYGVYAKGLAFQEGYPLQWEKMVSDHPQILQGSTNKYQNWETTDPERWVPHGYAIVRVDSRGAGWSPGFMDPGCPKEIDDLYECIEWAGTQPWSNGKVGMLGISYYASNQWRVAGMHPPHLAAIIPWEGQNDRYRDSGYHGGILCQFQERWAKHQVVNIQYGVGERAQKNPVTGEPVAGPVTLSDEELAKNRVNVYDELKKHPLDDEWHRARSADLSLVTTPLLT